MPTLTQDEINFIQNTVNPQKLRFQSIVRLCFASNGSWQYSGIMGACAIVTDIPKRTYFIRIVNMDSKQVAWEHEIYENFIYTTPTPWLLCFETDQDVIGLCFADDVEAKEFGVNISICKTTPVKTDEEKNNDKMLKQEEKKQRKRLLLLQRQRKYSKEYLKAKKIVLL